MIRNSARAGGWPESMGLGEHKSWFTEVGPDYDVVVSTRVRLARNVAGLPFPGFMSSTEEQAVATGIAQIFQDKFSSREYLVIDPSRLHPWSRTLLLERNLAADDFSDTVHTVLILRSDERFAASVNMVDHLRLSVLRGGNQIRDAYEEIDRVDRLIEEVIPYSVSLEWGYLNSEITNIGTGMRASVLLHLPALMETDRAPEVFETMARSGFMVKGFWVSDENTQARRSLGDMYQVSNLITIGVDERDIVEKLAKTTSQLVHYEQKARRDLMKGSKRTATTDRIAAAQVSLQEASSLSYRDAVESLSAVRLGISLGLVPDVRTETVTSLLFISQRSHILHAFDAAESEDGTMENAPDDGSTVGFPAMESAAIDERRAALVQQHLFPVG